MLKQHGFSLLELLTVLLIVGVLLTLAVPTWQHLIAAQRGTVVMQQLLNTINLARSEAIKRGVGLTLCGSTDYQTCASTWQHGQILFIDPEAKANVQNPALLLAVSKITPQQGLLYWHASRSNPYLQFEPTGNTRSQAGTFVYCPSNRDSRYAQAIVVSMSGRARWIRITNKDQQSDGLVLKCE